MKGAAVAVGVFDGVHLGHQEIVRRLRGEATRLAVPPVVLTFNPHPRPHAVQREGGLLMSADERAAALRALGVEWIVMMDFTPSVKAMEAEDFFREVLLAALGARAVIVGPTHRFGRGGAGDTTFLRHLCAEAGVDVVVAAECMFEGAPVSSRRIRAHLTAGEIVEASQALGRFYRIDGTVIRGTGLGRTLGFPTANLAPDHDRLVPANGVYGCLAHVDGEDYPAIANIGVAPTVRGSREGIRRIEVHLIDYDAALYGKRMGISFVAYVREEQRFPGVDGLRRQIREDVGRIRPLLKDSASRIRDLGSPRGEATLPR